MIAKVTIEAVKGLSRLADVIGNVVKLKKRGTSLTGCCPFHDEKTPSFHVNELKNIYKCFGCGKAGGLVTFVMEYNTLSYSEAVEWLAAKYDIPIEYEHNQSDESKQLGFRLEAAKIALAWVSKYYVQQMRDPVNGATARTYLQGRTLDYMPLSNDWGVGYAPADSSMMIQQAEAQGINLSILKSFGVLNEYKDGNKLFDRYKGRLIFPIHNEYGKVIGFGGRYLGSDKTQAKYINTPDTLLYSKGNVLYGLDKAKSEIKKQDCVYIVEGYTDVIRMHLAGITNTVATSGTALTDRQITHLTKFTYNWTLVFDGDTAGIHAALRGTDMLLSRGINLRVVCLPDNQDPDSFLTKLNTGQALDYFRQNAVDFLKYRINLGLAEVKDDPIGKAKLVNDILATIRLIRDPILRNIYAGSTAKLLQIDAQVIEQIVYDQHATSHIIVAPIEVHLEHRHEAQLIDLLVNYIQLSPERAPNAVAYFEGELSDYWFNNHLYNQVFGLMCKNKGALTIEALQVDLATTSLVANLLFSDVVHDYEDIHAIAYLLAVNLRLTDYRKKISDLSDKIDAGVMSMDEIATNGLLLSQWSSEYVLLARQLNKVVL